MYENEFSIIFDYAKDKTEDIEILLNESDTFSVRINKQEIESFSHSKTKGIGIRLLLNGKVGYSYVEKFTKESLENAVDMAIENAKNLEDDKKIVFENYQGNNKKLNFYNPGIEKVSVQEKIDFVKKLEELAYKADPRIENVNYCAYSDGTHYVKIANSKGLNKEDKSSIISSYVGVIASDGKEKRSGGENKLTLNFADLNAEEIVNSAVKKAVDLLGSKSIKSGSYPVLLNYEMMASLLNVFYVMFNSKLVQEGRSLLKGKLNQKVADEKVSIYDDATLENAFGSYNFDSEGYPAQKTTLIEKGVLKAYLYNSETAIKDNVKSTGNGSRTYKGTLGISKSNIIMTPGELSREEILRNKSKVIEIVGLQGLHSGANIISGDFSLSAEGFLWENGKRINSLKQFTVSGNFLTLLNNVEEIANDYHLDHSIGTASTLIKELSISG